MEGIEIDKALEDLETRIERLRALYEQYFMGFEKIEPQTPRNSNTFGASRYAST